MGKARQRQLGAESAVVEGTELGLRAFFRQEHLWEQDWLGSPSLVWKGWT